MKCLKCGKDYEPKRSTSKYCSSKCKQASYRNKVSVTQPEVTVTPVTLSGSEPVTVTPANQVDPRLEKQYVDAAVAVGMMVKTQSSNPMMVGYVPPRGQ